MPGEYTALAAFNKHTQKTGDWEAIKTKFLQASNLQEALEANIQKGLETLKTLIQYRDIIDFRLYRKAVEALFSPLRYNLAIRVNGDIDNSSGSPRFLSAWYEFIVTKRVARDKAEQETQCIIKISAPGSRSLTSDIDTSVTARFEGLTEALLEQVPELKDRGPDYAGRVAIAVIDGFYLLSEKEFGITSGEQRDSNAYIDLPDAENYPKFRDDESHNPKIAGRDLFEDKEDLGRKLAVFKLEKHALEIGASLFSLSLTLATHLPQGPVLGEQWQGFKTQVLAEVETCSQQFLSDGTVLNTKHTQQTSELISQDLQAVFKITEDLFSTYVKALSAKKKAVETSDYGRKSALGKEAKERDMEVAALNRLYVEYLEKMIDINGEILTLEKANRTLMPLLEKSHADLHEEQEKLQDFHKKPKLYQKEIPECQRRCAELSAEYESKLKTFKDNIFKIADSQIKKLKARYQAHLFANEALISRSAKYHVVDCMQKKGKLAMTEQTLLGSLLEQVGSKVLHTQTLSRQDLRKSSAEIAYRTSKYGQRMHHLLFASQDIEEGQIKHAVSTGVNKLGILAHLKSSVPLREYLFRRFSVEGLLLLNADLQIINKVKKNEAIPEQDKYAATEKLKSPIAKPQLFLSLASKTIAGVYLSKIERKKALWGSYVPEERKENMEKTMLVPSKMSVPKQDTPSSRTEGALAVLNHYQFKGKTNIETLSDEGLAETHMSDIVSEQDAIIRTIRKNPTQGPL